MSGDFYTKKDVADRYGCSLSCVDKWAAAGLLPKGVRGKPARYTKRQIDQLDKELGLDRSDEPMSPAERNRLMNEIKRRDKIIAELRRTISAMVTPALQYVNDIAAQAAEKENVG